ncbi:MAG: hypothetical protein ACMUIP_15215 [bacterium]
MRYYRIQVPDSAPLEWTLGLNQVFGDVAIFVRQALPPGQGSQWVNSVASASNYFQDWYDDNSYCSPNPYLVYDTHGDHLLTVPPVKPNHTYYLGVFAKTDAAFDLASSVGVGYIVITGEIDFYGGFVSNTVEPGIDLIYRIDVPDDATRWIHYATHDASVKLYINQETVPPKSSYAHWYSANYANSSFNKYLFDSEYLNNYPWQPGHCYYLLMENTTAAPYPLPLLWMAEIVTLMIMIMMGCLIAGNANILATYINIQPQILMVMGRIISQSTLMALILQIHPQFYLIENYMLMMAILKRKMMI